MIDNPFNLPDSYETDYPIYYLPTAATNILVLSDIHIPYHSISALTAAIKYGKDHLINTILLNGDVLDFYQLSKFTKDPRKRSVKDELDAFRSFILVLQKEIPLAKIYYKFGNHDNRYQNYLKLKAPELLDVLEFRLDILLKLGELGVECISDDRVVMAGKLAIIHGHEYNRGGITVNPARSILLKAKHSVLVSHSHVTSEDSKSVITGDTLTAWSTACLCELHPEYARLNDWNHGFAHVSLSFNGFFHVINKRIINGKIL